MKISPEGSAIDPDQNYPRNLDDPHDRPRAYLSSSIEGVGGLIKCRPEDFLVEEMPLVTPAGEGEHIWMFIEKRLLSTLDMVAVLAKHFRVARHKIGFAGLKDKHAITRQVVSVHLAGRRIEDLPMLDHPRIGVLWVDQHTERLRRGQLKGNRFSIRIRNVEISRVREAKRTLEALESLGAPNRVGPQRFGYLRTNHLLGRAMILGDAQRAVDTLLGPSVDEALAATDRQHAARQAYASGDLARARDLLSPAMQGEARVLDALIDGRPAHQALGRLDTRERSYFVSAFQSAVFNRLLDKRLAAGTVSTLTPGDVVFEHETRACTLLEDVSQAEALAGRLQGFEISPSGPMWGPDMPRACGEVEQQELAALNEFRVTPEAIKAFVDSGKGSSRDEVVVEGDRRPYRVPLTDPEIEAGVDEHGSYIRCAFDLPRGAFATVAMEEIMKNGRAGEVGLLIKGP